MNSSGIGTLIRIVEAGIEVFAEEGYSGAGTLEIAAKAGVAESTIFRKFATKEDLFRECLRTALSRSLDPAQFQALVSTGSGQAGFSDNMLAVMKRWYARLSVPAARLLLYASLSKVPEWRALSSERTNGLIHILADEIEKHAAGRRDNRPDPVIAATSLIATLLYLKSICPRPRERDPQLVETVVHQWLRGVVNP